MEISGPPICVRVGQRILTDLSAETLTLRPKLSARLFSQEFAEHGHLLPPPFMLLSSVTEHVGRFEQFRLKCICKAACMLLQECGRGVGGQDHGNCGA